MIFTLQVDLSTRKTPIDFQMQRSKDASAAAILTFRAEIVPFQSLSRVFTDFNIAGWSKHKEDTCWFSDATVKEHARGGHFSDFSIRKCSFPTIISSIYRLICMIFTLQVDLSTRKTPIDFQTGSSNVLVPFTNDVHQWCWALQLPTAFQLLLFFSTRTPYHTAIQMTQQYNSYYLKFSLFDFYVSCNLLYVAHVHIWLTATWVGGAQSNRTVQKI